MGKKKKAALLKQQPRNHGWASVIAERERIAREVHDSGLQHNYRLIMRIVRGTWA